VEEKNFWRDGYSGDDSCQTLAGGSHCFGRPFLETVFLTSPHLESKPRDKPDTKFIPTVAASGKR
jgi:hypothetical protein